MPVCVWCREIDPNERVRIVSNVQETVHVVAVHFREVVNRQGQPHQLFPDGRGEN